MSRSSSGASTARRATGFPFSPITTHDRGIVGRYAIGGHEEGFCHGIFFVADDFTVRQLEGYASSKISPPDLDRLIQATADKSRIQVSVYVTQGHPFAVVSSDDWTWEYDVMLQRWHERERHGEQPRPLRAKGVRLKFRFSDPVHFALMGGDLQFQPLRN